METNEAIVRRCVDTYNQATLEWVDTFYSRDVEWIELPRAGNPQGRRGNRDNLRECARNDTAVFADRRMRVIDAVAQGDRVAVELAWEGTAAHATGGLAQGMVVRLRIASFFILDKGLITRQVDYCTLAAPGDRAGTGTSSRAAAAAQSTAQAPAS
jgi:ketosteroid isomerase-like protein